MERNLQYLGSTKGTWTFLITMFVFRILLGLKLPITNDEAYYWDWSLQLQLSYIDHPPGVAWLTWLSRSLLNDGPLSARLFSPIFHLLASFVLLKCLEKFSFETERQRLGRRGILLILTQFIPGLSLWGVVILPDTGLYLFISIVFLLSLTYWDRSRLSLMEGIIYGLALGFAGAFKYHALPVAGGMALALFVIRMRKVHLDAWFWVSVIFFALIPTLPVWMWNIANDLASFKFQSAHGYAGLSFKPVYAARAWLGQLIFLTPAVAFGTIFLSLRYLTQGRLLSSRRLIVLFGFWPLFLLIQTVAPFKQTLPHWILPAFWVFLPFYSGNFSIKGRWHRVNLWLALGTGLILPAVVAFSPLTDKILESRAGDAGHLYEVTLWPKLAQLLDSTYSDDFRTQAQTEDKTSCSDKPYLAGLRWFWTAQMRYHLQDHPKVLNLDPNHRSYYTFRDENLDLKGCSVIIIAHDRHIDRDLLATLIDIESEEKLLVPLHEKMNIYLLRGRFLR